ncbi:MAG: hypothetical protein HY709_08105 [Candidatus Latescibacteria bacterium]|nr:hypothetical protein [Candidatus Latescibacterota bacterium]
MGDYLDQAGGLTENGDKDKVFLQEPTGITRRVKGYGPEVADGSVIRVGVKPPEQPGEPIKWTELAKEIASLTSSFITIIFIISRATN